MAQKLGTRSELLLFLREKGGIPLAKSTLDKLCSPAIAAGPPVAAWWGNRPIYDFDEGMAWAQSRLRSTRQPPAKPTRVREVHASASNSDMARLLERVRR